MPRAPIAQRDTVDQFKVFCQFQFTDRLKESGITFVNHARTAARHYNRALRPRDGIAVADVDGDGLYDIYFVNQVGGNELWKNIGGGKFRNITERSGVGLPGRISVALPSRISTTTAIQDLFVTTVLGGNVLFEE